MDAGNADIMCKLVHALTVMGHDLAVSIFEDLSVRIESLTALIGLGVPW
jgi:hypothetical protein